MTTATLPPRPSQLSEVCDCDAVIEVADQMLRQRDLRLVRCVDVSCVGDSLVLRGSVPTYHIKQLAQEAVRGIHGVERIENLISVYDVHQPQVI